jgi:hypothetical protein
MTGSSPEDTCTNYCLWVYDIHQLSQTADQWCSTLCTSCCCAWQQCNQSFNSRHTLSQLKLNEGLYILFPWCDGFLLKWFCVGMIVLLLILDAIKTMEFIIYFVCYPVGMYRYSTSQKFGHTYSFQGFSLFLLFSTLQNNSGDVKTMKHIWKHVVTKKLLSK